MEIYGFFSIMFTACINTDGMLTSNIHGDDRRSNGAIFQLFELGSFWNSNDWTYVILPLYHQMKMENSYLITFLHNDRMQLSQFTNSW